MVSACTASSPTQAPPADAEEPPPPQAPTTTGGEGRVTVAVPPAAAERLLAVDHGAFVVTAQGTHREFELAAVLRRAGGRLHRFTVGSDGPLGGRTLRDADVRDTHGVAVIAVRHDGAWTFGPSGDARIDPGDEVFVAGPRQAVTRFMEVAR
ncbi:MAG: potassium channel family protein [Halobacteriaceae archaeon]